MVTKYQSFLTNNILVLFECNTTFMLLTNIGGWFLTFAPIGRRWYTSMTSSSTTFFNAVKFSTKVDVCTYVFLFMTSFLVLNPPSKEYMWLNLPLPYHVHGLHIQKCSGIINEIEVLGIFHQYLPVNMSTYFQNTYSYSLSYTPYLWSGVEDWCHILALDIPSDTQTPSLLTPGVFP